MSLESIRIEALRGEKIEVFGVAVSELKRDARASIQNK